MDRRITPEEVQQILEQHLRIPGWRLRKPKDGWSENSFVGGRDNRRVFVKFDVSVPVLRRLAALYIAPALLAAGQHRQQAFVIQEFIDGVHPDRDWLRRHLAETAQLIRRYQRDAELATIVKEVTHEGRDDSVSARVTDLDRRIRIIDSPVFASKRLLFALEEFRAQSRLLEEVGLVPTHGDLSRKNFLITDKQIFLVDWDEVALADPLRDVGPFLWWYVPRERWNAFFDSLGMTRTRGSLGRLFWWVAEESLDIALALEERGYQQDVPEFLEDFTAAIRGHDNPHFVTE